MTCFIASECLFAINFAKTMHYKGQKETHDTEQSIINDVEKQMNRNTVSTCIYNINMKIFICE